MFNFWVSVVTLCVALGQANAAEPDALAISANIQARHMPFGTILDPVFASPTSDDITGYTHCGDSALWTGAYLAAEAFRYNVTQSADALANVKGALAGLKALTDVTGDNRLARCMVFADSPYAAGISSEEAHNTIHQAPPWIWVDNTSRDQVVGAFFGLGAAFDLVDDADVKSGISDLATRLIGFISGHLWSPNDDISNTFELRPEELQMLLQVARHVNPANKISGPFIVPPVDAGAIVDVQSDDSYFKFNLDFLTFYNLVRLQNNEDNRHAYQIVRDHVASHQNALFDVIDRALNGANDARDAETLSLLDQWLARPTRDLIVDLSQTVPMCGSQACAPVPVPERPPADFIWQVSPFQTLGGLYGTIEEAGIDYILPYWMARYYGVIVPPDVSSSAAATAAVAPGELASVYQLGLPSGAATVSVTDATGATFPAPVVFANTDQVSFVVPDGMAAGRASFTVSAGGVSRDLHGAVQSVAPALFTMTGTGMGVAAATAVSVSLANPAMQTQVPVFQCGDSGCAAVPIALPDNATVFVAFYATGVRNRTSLDKVTVTVNGTSVPVTYAGPNPWIQGLDQVYVTLPTTLRGIGAANIVVTADGQLSNAVTLSLQ
jgi:uncharacterized protein (TIGR03437 family)